MNRTEPPVGTPWSGAYHQGSAPPLLWSRRTWITVIAFLGMVFAAMDQVTLPVLMATPSLHRLFALTPIKIGALVSIFVLMQAVFNFLLGPLVDWLRARKAAFVEALSWTAVMVGTATAGTYGGLFVWRLLLGVVEGLRIPINQRLVKEWFPVKERARANSFWQVGVPVGTALGVPLTVALYRSWGWRGTYLAFAALTLIVLLPLVWLFAHPDPASDPRISPRERQYIAAGLKPEQARTAGMSWRAAAALLARTPGYWLLILLTMSNAGFSYGLTGWLPQYLVHTRHFSLHAVGILASLPFVAQLLSVLLAGVIGDKWRLAPTCLIGYVCTAACLYGAIHVSSDLGSAWLLIAATFFMGAGNLTAATLAMTIVPRQVVSSGTGLTSGVGVAFSSVIPLVMGAVIASTHQVGSGFEVLIATSLLGIGVLGFLTRLGY